jgi:DNA (cytosine-5)-methyltransferase 1
MEKILILKVLDLFSGIGGFSLALESTGHFETIAFVEKDEFCQKVLAKNFKGIPIEGDIRNVKGNRYQADVITGGFPCQPFSVAGKRKGTDDDRYLWDETIRVIRECKPKWFIGENVEGIINIQDGMVLRQVQNDLEEEGFEVRCLIIPASSKGAWHQRKRVWILANSNSGVRGRGRAVEQGRAKQIWGFCAAKEEQPECDIRSEAVGCNAVLRKEDVSNTQRKGLERYSQYSSTISRQKQRIQSRPTNSTRQSTNKNVSNTKHERFSQGMQSKTTSNGNRQRESEGKETWWQTQSRVCGVPNGVSYELDKNRAKRVKALGNSIVPQIVYEIGKAIILAESD